MYQNMRVPVITGDFISDPTICTYAEIKKDKEVVAPVTIGSASDNIKYGLLIEYGNYLYIENKPNSGYNIVVSFETPSKNVKKIVQGTNYSIEIVCKTFLELENVNTKETVLFTS